MSPNIDAMYYSYSPLVKLILVRTCPLFFLYVRASLRSVIIQRGGLNTNYWTAKANGIDRIKVWMKSSYCTLDLHLAIFLLQNCR